MDLLLIFVLILIAVVLSILVIFSSFLVILLSRLSCSRENDNSSCSCRRR